MTHRPFRLISIRYVPNGRAWALFQSPVLSVEDHGLDDFLGGAVLEGHVEEDHRHGSVFVEKLPQHLSTGCAAFGLKNLRLVVLQESRHLRAIGFGRAVTGLHGSDVCVELTVRT